MAAILTDVTSFVTASVGWIGDFVDVIVIVRKEYLNNSFEDNKKSLAKALKKVRII